MPPYIPFQSGFLAPGDRNVYQGYDNPESPDAVRANMDQWWAPPQDYYGLDAQGNRKKFMFDNGQLANMYEQHAGAQSAAMLQDARLRKAKNDIVFMQSLRGGIAPSPAPEAGPNVFGAPQAEDDARLQQLLQGRANAETRGWNLFGAGIKQQETNDAKARAIAKENLAYQSQLFGLKSAMANRDYQLEDRDQRQQDRLELQANALDAKAQDRKGKNFQSALANGAINTPQDVVNFFGRDNLTPQDMATYRNMIAQRDSVLADNLGSLIAQGRISGLDDLSNRVGKSLSGDQYGALVQQLAKTQAGQATDFNQTQQPFVGKLNEGYANLQKQNVANLDKNTHFWSSDNTKNQLKQANADALNRFVSDKLTSKEYQNVVFDPQTQTFKSRLLPGDMMDAVPYMRTPGQSSAPSATANVPFQFAQLRPVARPVPYQPDPYRFGGRPDYVSNPNHFGESPNPPQYPYEPLTAASFVQPAQSPVFKNGIRVVRSDAEYASIPSGRNIQYIGPDGITRTKR